MRTDPLDEVRDLLSLDEPARSERLAALARTDPDRAESLRSLIETLGAQTRHGEPARWPAEPVMPERIARYRIERLLGEGGMGTVYLARQDQPEREVALKLIRAAARDAEALARFRIEGDALAQLEHPGIARIYEAGSATIGGRELPWLAMEYVRGPDLLGHAAQQALDTQARLALLVGLCQAVQHAHGRGVIHRDLKPQNILVDPLGQPKILDFGVARIEGREAGMTQLGQVVGTLGYMSPEQLGGEARQADARSDVYALGAIAYQLLSGQLPYPDLPRSSLIEALDRVRRSEPEPLGKREPSLRGDIETVVMKALSTDPAARYASAGAFGDDLQRILDHRPVEARPPTPGYLLGRFARRHRVLVAASSMVLLALVAAVAVSLGFAWSESAARAEAEQRAAEADAVSGFLSRMLTSADPEQSLGRDLRVSEVLSSAAVDLDADQGLPQAVRARLLSVLGRVQVQLGETDDGLVLLDRAAALAAAVDGLEDEILLTRADALFLSGSPAEAEALLRARLDHAAPLSDVLEVGLRTGQARAAMVQGRAEEAERDNRALLQMARERLGPGHEASLTVAHNLAGVLQLQARYAEALELNAEVIARRSERFGPDHPQTLFARNLRAVLLFRQGEIDAAREAFREVLAARRATLGEEHPSTWITAQNLGTLLVDSGELEEGIDLLEQSLTRLGPRFGPASGYTLMARDGLARGLEQLGRLDEAEVLLRDILAAHEAISASPRAELLVARNNLAMLLGQLGRHVEALAEFDRVLEGSLAVFGESNPYTGIFRGNRGECLARLGRVREARAELGAALAALEASMGAEHARTRKVAAQLAALPAP